MIVPSHTFVFTANTFVLRGARPVFVDVRPYTLKIDERLIEQAIRPRTRAVFPIHYAGVAGEVDTIMAANVSRSHRPGGTRRGEYSVGLLSAPPCSVMDRA